jgi:ethanolamine kinase
MQSYPIIENVTLSFPNISNEIYPLIKSIRPDWTSLNTRLVTFTEGITNIILGLFDTRIPDNDSTALIIKIYGAQTELFIDRKAEINAMTRFYEHGVFAQRILIQFNNGIIYEYASGKTCSRDDVRKENIARLIAIKLAQFHNVPVQEMEKPYVVLLLRRFLKLLNENSLDLSSITSDIDIIEERILPRLIPNAKLGEDLVLCHNDLLVKNIIYNEKDQTVSFIDFEYTHLNYALFDIADHFVEYSGVENADFSIYPTRDEQKRWLEIYFQTRGMNHQIINDDLCQLVDQFAALAHLMWGLWALVQAEVSKLDFDYINYAKMRFDAYKRLRPLLFEKE